jgi:hypothetical protein
MNDLLQQPARDKHKTINDLVEFHSIRGSWDFNEKILEGGDQD